MDHLYILVGQTPVPCADVLEWAQWFEETDRHVFKDNVASCFVSTVFLGIDHDFLGGGPPILFETMVFTDGGHDILQDRCSTWLEAEAQHKRIVEELEVKYGVQRDLHQEMP